MEGDYTRRGSQRVTKGGQTCGDRQNTGRGVGEMLRYRFGIDQDEDGQWFYYNDGDGRKIPWDSFPTREQCERAVAWFNYRLEKGDEIELRVKERMRVLIHRWADQLTRETGIDRQEVLLDIGLGINDAVDELCPIG
jgi:hypothetical protein